MKEFGIAVLANIIGSLVGAIPSVILFLIDRRRSKDQRSNVYSQALTFQEVVQIVNHHHTIQERPAQRFTWGGESEVLSDEQVWERLLFILIAAVVGTIFMATHMLQVIALIMFLAGATSFGLVATVYVGRRSEFLTGAQWRWWAVFAALTALSGLLSAASIFHPPFVPKDFEQVRLAVTHGFSLSMLGRSSGFVFLIFQLLGVLMFIIYIVLAAVTNIGLVFAIWAVRRRGVGLTARIADFLGHYWESPGRTVGWASSIAVLSLLCTSGAFLSLFMRL